MVQRFIIRTEKNTRVASVCVNPTDHSPSFKLARTVTEIYNYKARKGTAHTLNCPNSRHRMELTGNKLSPYFQAVEAVLNTDKKDFTFAEASDDSGCVLASEPVLKDGESTIKGAFAIFDHLFKVCCEHMLGRCLAHVLPTLPSLDTFV